MWAAGTKINKYVDKFFDLLTNWFISICFYHATFVSRNTFILHPFVHSNSEARAREKELEPEKKKEREREKERGETGRQSMCGTQSSVDTCTRKQCTNFTLSILYMPLLLSLHTRKVQALPKSTHPTVKRLFGNFQDMKLFCNLFLKQGSRRCESKQ